jgi:hypothetical protein
MQLDRGRIYVTTIVLLYLYHQQVWCYSANSTNWSGATYVKIYGSLYPVLIGAENR